MIFRCCCVFSGSPVSCYMRTRVDICTSYMYNVKEKKKGCLQLKRRRGTHMPPTWSGALSPHHHLKVLAAPSRMPSSTWLRGLRSRIVLFPGARALRARASLRVVVRTVCLPVWLLGASVHLVTEIFRHRLRYFRLQAWHHSA